MFARKLFTGIVTGGVALSVISLTATSASAATDPDDSPGTPVSANLIGVGSDTTQGVLRALADAYNQTSASSGGQLFTYAATGGGDVAIPGGTIPRPNGSTAGKNRLNGNGSGDTPEIDFARSSSAISTTEANNGLRAFPFALDTLGTVTAPSSNAPASLTRAQILSIYKGDVTNWSQLGGTAGEITAYIPQDGSGTRSFFIAQLTAENGNVAPTIAARVQTFQENDDTLIKNNPNAIAPFSTGRAGLLGTLRVEGGFLADRAVYNVVRQTQQGSAAILNAFGPTGFLCSAAATGIIEDGGFRQLATAGQGGSCGEVTSSSASSLTTRERANTSTSLAFSSPAASQARLVATVTSSSAPQGTVTFSEGSTVIASGVQLVSGQATRTFAASPGTHTYTATFVPAGGSLFRRSSASVGGVVTAPGGAAAAKASSGLSESFPGSTKAKVKTVKGKKKTTIKAVKGSVTVTLAGSSAKGTGTILVKRGSTTVGTGSLAGGVATFALKGLKKGNNGLTATWGGDANASSSTLNFSVKVSVPKKKKK